MSETAAPGSSSPDRLEANRDSSPRGNAEPGATANEPGRLKRIYRRLRSNDRFHWEVGAGILAVAAAALAIGWYLAAEDRSRQIFYVYYTVGAAVPLLAVWWFNFSGVSKLARRRSLAALAVAAGAFVLLFRHDGFEGDFIPIFTPRWARTGEERALEYFQTQDVLATTPVDAAEPLVVTEADWPQFRGPTRKGVVRGVSIRRDWESSPPKELWRHRVGPGWSSFAVVDGLAFTQEQRGEEEVVVCYDVQTGKQVWVHADVDRLKAFIGMGGDGPRATPTVYDSRLYTLGGRGILNCLEPRTGRVLWSRNIIVDAGGTKDDQRAPKVPDFGMCSSPFVHGDHVIVSAGGGQNQGVIAYDRKSGDIVWRKGDRRVGYASPVLGKFNGSEQLLIFGADGLAGHDRTTGDELWWFKWNNDTSNNCVDPLVLHNENIFLSTGYSKGTVLLALDHGKENRWHATPTLWKTSKRFKLKISGSVVKDEYIYGLDENILCCFDPLQGTVKWKSGRYGYGQLLLVDDVLLITSDKGDVALVEANPERYREIAKFAALKEGTTWNHPVLYRGLLLVRSDQEAACFDLRPNATAAVE